MTGLAARRPDREFCSAAAPTSRAPATASVRHEGGADRCYGREQHGACCRRQTTHTSDRPRRPAARRCPGGFVYCRASIGSERWQRIACGCDAPAELDGTQISVLEIPCVPAQDPTESILFAAQRFGDKLPARRSASPRLVVSVPQTTTNRLRQGEAGQLHRLVRRRIDDHRTYP